MSLGTHQRQTAPWPSGEEGPVPHGAMNGYRLTDLVGRGGFGLVFRGLQTSNGRIVAIKVIPLDGKSDEKQRKSIREAEILAKLKHSHIVGSVEYFAAPYQGELKLVMVMEYLDRADLSCYLKYLRDKHCYLNEFIVSALEYIHALGIIHRDLKLQNILMRSADNGNAVLTDFGVSVCNCKPGSVNRGRAGTVEYMSPEMAIHKKYDEKTDIWSLGVMLFELMTYVRPFSNESALLQYCQGQTALPSVSKEYTSQIRGLLESMLSVNPEMRPSAKVIGAWKCNCEFADRSHFINYDTTIEIPGQTVPASQPITGEWSDIDGLLQHGIEQNGRDQKKICCLIVSCVVLLAVALGVLLRRVLDQ